MMPFFDSIRVPVTMTLLPNSLKNGRTNKLKQSASEINADLLKYYAEIQNVFKEFEVQETIPTTQQLKDAFNLRMKDTSEEQQEETQISFWEVFDEFVKECGNQNNWTASTYEKFSAVKNHLKEFKEDVTFEYFNEFGLNEYVNFLRDKKDMRNSTIGKQMGFLKWFLRWSFKKGHHQNIAYDTFKPKLKTTSKKVIFLTWDELNRLKDYRIPKDKQYLERVRDVFLFCCFTSLRYSDVRNLKRSDVKPDHIEVTTVKTADSLIIELNDHSKTILEKYKEVHFENHMALPVISNQKMNDYLKELGELAEINEPVTSVTVGTQVSGIVSKLYVDYNSVVKKGQVIAELDKTNLVSQLNASKATLASAQSKLNYESANFKRYATLYKKGLVSADEYENAQLTYKQAKDQVATAKEDVQRAQTNLGYATITSPIDGVVLSKSVEEGQTVAASFSTPELFTIAQNLKEMQVVADVDEADLHRHILGASPARQ